MTYQSDFTLPSELLEQIAAQGFDVLPELIRVVINAAMQAERQQYLRAAPYQHTPDRRGHANGFKPKTVKTRLGKITFDVPQVREGGFYPEALEKGQRSERALTLTLAEMYVQGVSTRKVTAIVEQLCGSSVSSSVVSRAVALLDETLEAWRDRPLGEFPYVFLDARYEKVRQDGQIRDAAILIAIGVGQDGKRQILGVSVSLSEHEVHWRTFLQSLVARGLNSVQLITSDDHAGLKAARIAVFGGVPWQRCQFHLQQNAGAHVPRQDMRKEVAEELRTIFNAPDRHTAKTYLAKTVQKYAKTVPALADWLEKNIPEGLTVFSFPVSHRRRLRTANSLERLSREVKRRTRVVSIFPNEAACLRLISAVLMEIDEAWQTHRIYLMLETNGS
ncbi:MAG TPA: IS256 family transposase [Anaerolineales bacterium]|jgi:transposase-like protein|nr:IS256 family transposase [Anaerolineales bacterium]